MIGATTACAIARRSRASILLATVLVAAFVVATVLLCVRPASCGEFDLNHGDLRWFWVAAAALWSALSVVAWQLSQTDSVLMGSEPDEPTNPISTAATITCRTARHQARAMCFIVMVALGARVIVVMGTAPQLSDDLFRYIYDGRTLARGHNPYARSPNDATVDNSLDATLVSQINHGDLATLYLPVSQYVFAALAVVQGSTFDPIVGRTFRMGFVTFDMIVIALLLGRLKTDRRSPWWAILYAWHPLAISEVAGSGHQDVIGIAILFALLCLFNRTVRTARTVPMAIAGVLFAASLCVKPIIAPLAIAIAWFHRSHRQLVAVAACTTGLTIAVLGTPFLILNGGVSGLFDTAGIFVTGWSHNGSIHAILTYAFGWHVATTLCVGLLMAVLWGALAARCELSRIAMIYLFSAVLLSSTAHPWYLLWALALLPLRFDVALWTMSLTIGWSYVVLHDVEAWHVPVWVSVIQYVPVYALITVKMVRWCQGMRTRKLV